MFGEGARKPCSGKVYGHAICECQPPESPFKAEAEVMLHFASSKAWTPRCGGSQRGVRRFGVRTEGGSWLVGSCAS